MRRWLAPAWITLLVVIAGCGPDPAPEYEGPPLDAGRENPPVTLPVVPQVYLDLVARADGAHVLRRGPVYGPGVPGWLRVSQLADRGPWGPGKPMDGRTGAWLDSIGATLHFPVGAEGPDLTAVELWLRPIANGQRVSVFLNEEPLKTFPVSPGMHRYRLELPEGGLSPGEHSLRFWFRFTRWRGKGRTPAALAGLRLVPKEGDLPLPASWYGPLSLGDKPPRPALFAAPPTVWRYHLLPPTGARLFARAAVVEGPPVEFVVRIEEDGQPPAELTRVTVQPGVEAELDVPLAAYAERPVRLELATEGPGAEAMARAAWLEPQILRPGLPRTRLPPVRNVVLWVVDGLRADRVRLGRGGERAATPNLDLLAAEGAAAVGVWSGGAEPAEGHRRLLMAGDGAAHLADLVGQGERRTGLLTASSAIDPALAAPFNTRLDLRRAGEPAQTPVIMRELDAWLDARGRSPFFLYVATEDPMKQAEGDEGYPAAYLRRRRPHGPTAVLSDEARAMLKYDAAVSTADYWIGQLIALLEVHGVRDDTLVIVTGSVGHDFGLAEDGQGLRPGVLQVPAVVWHPGLRGDGRPRPLSDGGDLADVGATILAALGQRAPEGWGGVDMATALFNGRPLPPHPSHARSGNQVAARFGHWLLRGPGSRDLRIWNLREDPAAREELSGQRPIALRTLRDSMQDRP